MHVCGVVVQIRDDRRGGEVHRDASQVPQSAPVVLQGEPCVFWRAAACGGVADCARVQQLHKIPGTPYASVSSAQLNGGPPPDSFKARMEMLQDKSSTNLYMEGLPMSTDDKMLGALVRPYRIMSSRFFQTRLSSPPKIIAFVR